MQPILSADHLTKILAGRTIVDDLSLEIQPGEVLGFLGPNGAGKTTTIRMLVGLIRPTRGSVQVGGIDLRRDLERALRLVGCIVETPDLYRFMTGRENLEHFARMLGDIAQEEIERVAELTLLDRRLDEKVRTYSLGMRQRLGIAVALLGRPRLLILDEPANGLDPVGIRDMRALLRRTAHEEGVGILVSSHLLAEVELMCDRVAIINRGRLVRTGSVHELISSHQELEIHANPLETALRLLAPLAGEMRKQGDRIRAVVDESRIPLLVRTLADAGVDVYSVKTVLPTLEELFLEVTGGETVE